MTKSADMPRRAGPIRVLLVDDHQHVLWGLAKLIDGEWPRMMVVGMSSDMAEAELLIESRAPDVVVLDIFVGGRSVLDVMPTLFGSSPSAVIVHTASQDADVRRRALVAGAKSVVDKDAPGDTLLREIDRLHRSRRKACSPS